MEELITYALEDYQALALALAQDPERLAEIRARLQENRLTHPLFDSDKYVENFELALDNLWSNYLAGKEAEGFAVSTL